MQDRVLSYVVIVSDRPILLGVASLKASGLDKIKPSFELYLIIDDCPVPLPVGSGQIEQLERCVIVLHFRRIEHIVLLFNQEGLSLLGECHQHYKNETKESPRGSV